MAESWCGPYSSTNRPSSYYGDPRGISRDLEKLCGVLILLYVCVVSTVENPSKTIFQGPLYSVTTSSEHYSLPKPNPHDRCPVSPRRRGLVLDRLRGTEPDPDRGLAGHRRQRPYTVGGTHRHRQDSGGLPRRHRQSLARRSCPGLPKHTRKLYISPSRPCPPISGSIYNGR